MSPMPTDRTWLDPVELRTWISVVAVLETLPGAIDRQLKDDSDLNLFEYTVLAMLSEQPEHSMPMTDLAAIAFGSLSRLSHAVSRLEKRGWLERSAGVGGRRHNVVSLSNDGVAAVQAAAPAHALNVRHLLLDPLDPGEVELLGDLLVKVLSRAAPELHAQFDDLVARTVERNRDDGGRP